MDNKPFKFGTSKKDLEKLFKILEKFKLKITNIKKFHLNEVWTISHPWVKKNLKIEWLNKYCLDGIDIQNHQLNFLEEGKIKFSIDFNDLLHQRINVKLRHKITQLLAKELNKYFKNLN